ncbi:DC-STAMP domain-containing protein 2 [Polymixia lowei]
MKCHGFSSRAAGRVSRCGRRKVRGHVLEAGRSVGVFLLGLVLASLYGLLALYLHNQDLWFSVYSTVGVASLAAFGMGLSVNIRANVLLMLPTLCSAKGKKLLLFLIMSMLLRGPVTNTLHNFEQAADSVVCGAELTMNHTQELMQRAATPLLPVLDSIREITSKAYSVSGRVHNFIQALTQNVHHVACTLRNVLHFLVDIGDVCNAKLGTPYRKCTALFDEARADCTQLLGIFNFLCDIVDGFRPLCGLARAGQLFCVIPSYIARHLSKRLAAPTVAALERMKQEFEFNISASVTFDLDMNSSQSLQEVSQEILEEVSLEVARFQSLSGFLGYVGLLILALTYLQAVMYRHRYLHQDDFDNIYITDQFEELDQRRTRDNRPTVLPLSKKETSTYITPWSVYPTPRERRAAVLESVSVLRHMAVGGLLVALDLLVFWMLEVVHHQAQGDVIARAPVIVEVCVNGTGYASDIFKDVVASFNILQGGNITVLSKKCLLEPSEPHYTGYVIIGEDPPSPHLHPEPEEVCRDSPAEVCSQEQGRWRRRKEQSAPHSPATLYSVPVFCNCVLYLCSVTVFCNCVHCVLYLCSVTVFSSCILYLCSLCSVAVFCNCVLYLCSVAVFCTCVLYLCSVAVFCNCVLYLCSVTVFSSCVLYLCSVPVFCNCVLCVLYLCSVTVFWLYCRPCFQSLGNICVVCMGPLIFQEDSEEELDSSDEEQLSLWAAALSSPHITHPRTRKLMKRRISVATRRRPPTGPGPAGTESRVQRAATGGHVGIEQETDSESSGHISEPGDSDNSEPDMAYQNHSETDSSDSNASFHTVSMETTNSSIGSLQIVSVH